MSDRELLEWAAKAYWHGEIDDVMSFRWDEQEQAIVYTHADNQDHNGNDVELLWIPLTDDGDALRLAVKLGLAVIPYPIYAQPKHSVVAKRYRDSSAVYRDRDLNIEEIEVYEGDPYAATRRAIVRAAAEIGKNL